MRRDNQVTTWGLWYVWVHSSLTPKNHRTLLYFGFEQMMSVL